MLKLVTVKTVAEALQELRNLQPVLDDLFKNYIIPSEKSPHGTKAELLRFYAEFSVVLELLANADPSSTLVNFRANYADLSKIDAEPLKTHILALNIKDNSMSKLFEYMHHVITAIQVHDTNNGRDRFGITISHEETLDNFYHCALIIGTILTQISTESRCPITLERLDELATKSAVYLPDGRVFDYQNLQKDICRSPKDEGLLRENGLWQKFAPIAGNIYKYLISKHSSATMAAIGITEERDIFRFINVEKRAPFSLEEIDLIVQTTLHELECNQQKPTANPATTYLHYNPAFTQSIIEERDTAAIQIALESAQQESDQQELAQQELTTTQQTANFRMVMINRIVTLLPGVISISNPTIDLNVVINTLMSMTNILPLTLMDGNALNGTVEQQKEIINRIFLMAKMYDASTTNEEIQALLDPDLSDTAFRQRIANKINQMPTNTAETLMNTLPTGLCNEILPFIDNHAIKKIIIKMKIKELCDSNQIIFNSDSLSYFIERISLKIILTLNNTLNGTPEQQKETIKRILLTVKMYDVYTESQEIQTLLDPDLSGEEFQQRIANKIDRMSVDNAMQLIESFPNSLSNGILSLMPNLTKKVHLIEMVCNENKNCDQFIVRHFIDQIPLEIILKLVNALDTLNGGKTRQIEIIKRILLIQDLTKYLTGIFAIDIEAFIRSLLALLDPDLSNMVFRQEIANKIDRMSTNTAIEFIEHILPHDLRNEILPLIPYDAIKLYPEIKKICNKIYAEINFDKDRDLLFYFIKKIPSEIISKLKDALNGTPEHKIEIKNRISLICLLTIKFIDPASDIQEIQEIIQPLLALLDPDLSNIDFRQGIAKMIDQIQPDIVARFIKKTRSVDLCYKILSLISNPTAIKSHLKITIEMKIKKLCERYEIIFDPDSLSFFIEKLSLESILKLTHALNDTQERQKEKIDRLIKRISFIQNLTRNLTEIDAQALMQPLLDHDLSDSQEIAEMIDQMIDQMPANIAINIAIKSIKHILLHDLCDRILPLISNNAIKLYLKIKKKIEKLYEKIGRDFDLDLLLSFMEKIPSEIILKLTNALNDTPEQKKETINRISLLYFLTKTFTDPGILKLKSEFSAPEFATLKFPPLTIGLQPLLDPALSNREFCQKIANIIDQIPIYILMTIIYAKKLSSDLRSEILSLISNPTVKLCLKIKMICKELNKKNPIGLALLLAKIPPEIIPKLINALDGDKTKQIEIINRISLVNHLNYEGEDSGFSTDIQALYDPDLSNAEFCQRIAHKINQMPTNIALDFVEEFLPHDLSAEILPFMSSNTIKLYLKIKMVCEENRIEFTSDSIRFLIRTIPSEIIPKLTNALDGIPEQQKETINRISLILNLARSYHKYDQLLDGKPFTERLLKSKSISELRTVAQTFIQTLLAPDKEFYQEIAKQIKQMPIDIAFSVIELLPLDLSNEILSFLPNNAIKLYLKLQMVCTNNKEKRIFEIFLYSTSFSRSHFPFIEKIPSEIIGKLVDALDGDKAKQIEIITRISLIQNLARSSTKIDVQTFIQLIQPLLDPDLKDTESHQVIADIINRMPISTYTTLSCIEELPLDLSNRILYLISDHNIRLYMQLYLKIKIVCEENQVDVHASSIISFIEKIPSEIIGKLVDALNGDKNKQIEIINRILFTQALTAYFLKETKTQKFIQRLLNLDLSNGEFRQIIAIRMNQTSPIANELFLSELPSDLRREINEYRANQAPLLAFFGGQHKRVGVNSPAKKLPGEVTRLISHFFKQDTALCSVKSDSDSDSTRPGTPTLQNYNI